MSGKRVGNLWLYDPTAKMFTTFNECDSCGRCLKIDVTFNFCKKQTKQNNSQAFYLFIYFLRECHSDCQPHRYEETGKAGPQVVRKFCSINLDRLYLNLGLFGVVLYCINEVRTAQCNRPCAAQAGKK